jgi:hypothetical protein
MGIPWTPVWQGVGIIGARFAAGIWIYLPVAGMSPGHAGVPTAANVAGTIAQGRFRDQLPVGQCVEIGKVKAARGHSLSAWNLFIGRVPVVFADRYPMLEIARSIEGDTSRKGKLRTLRLEAGSERFAALGDGVEDGAVEGGAGYAEAGGDFGDRDIGGFE